MTWLVLLAAKSFVITGGALLLLKLMQKRSPADRSWIAHLALAALLMLPLASFALPMLDVVGPEVLVGKTEVQSTVLALPSIGEQPQAKVAPSAHAADASRPKVSGAPVDWPFWGYITPAAVLLLLTLMALARLAILKARATVLIDAPWLTALARAQKRMGFKHGTALLISNELPSPISWGVVRPVILLNSEAAESHYEAEAIITHELAHVARLDWAKLLLARVAVALFWFNPFVWLLSREAHQLREEAADDAVLATDIDGAEYASLLVGVARHECRGILIGAHGVAPGRNSLTRRVKRVLDNAVKRAPGGWRWGSAAAFFAAGMVVPVAALNLVPAAAATDGNYPAIGSSASAPLAAASASTGAVLAASGSNNVDTVTPSLNAGVGQGEGTELRSTNGSTIITNHGQTVLRSSNGSTITIAAPDSSGRRRTVLQNANGSVVAFADANAVPGLAIALATSPSTATASNSVVDRTIAMTAVGASSDYVSQIRSVAPQLGLNSNSIVEMKALGVTPSFLQELARFGYRNVTANDITEAYAVGVREDYIRALAAAGYNRLPLAQITQLKTVGVTPADLDQYRRAGHGRLDPDKLVQLKTLGITPEQLGAGERSGP